MVTADGTLAMIEIVPGSGAAGTGTGAVTTGRGRGAGTATRGEVGAVCASAFTGGAGAFTGGTARAGGAATTFTGGGVTGSVSAGSTRGSVAGARPHQANAASAMPAAPTTKPTGNRRPPATGIGGCGGIGACEDIGACGDIGACPDIGAGDIGICGAATRAAEGRVSSGMGVAR